jgi:UPF0271 protein
MILGFPGTLRQRGAVGNHFLAGPKPQRPLTAGERVQYDCRKPCIPQREVGMIEGIDFNSDMGESFGLYRYGADEEVIRHISSANIACGFHGGDPTVLRRTVALAGRHGVAVGAHVGFPDLLGFGRRRLDVRPADVKDYVTYQIGALQAFLHAAGMPLQHIKPHGALYMMALEDEALARAIVEAALEADAGLKMYTIRDSATDVVARRCGMRAVAEFFADRGYHSDGRVKMFDWTLAEAGGTPAAIAGRVLRLLQQGMVAALEGSEVRLTAETVCVHSDTPGAGEIAAAIRQALGTAGIAVRVPV